MTPIVQEHISASACRRNPIETLAVPALALVLLLVSTVVSGQPPLPSSPLEQHCATEVVEQHRLQQTIQRLQREHAALIRQLAEAQTKLRALSGIERSIERNQVPGAPL